MIRGCGRRKNNFLTCLTLRIQEKSHQLSVFLEPQCIGYSQSTTHVGSKNSSHAGLRIIFHPYSPVRKTFALNTSLGSWLAKQ